MHRPVTDSVLPAPEVLWASLATTSATLPSSDEEDLQQRGPGQGQLLSCAVGLLTACVYARERRVDSGTMLEHSCMSLALPFCGQEHLQQPGPGL